MRASKPRSATPLLLAALLCCDLGERDLPPVTRQVDRFEANGWTFELAAVREGQHTGNVALTGGGKLGGCHCGTSYDFFTVRLELRAKAAGAPEHTLAVLFDRRYSSATSAHEADEQLESLAIERCQASADGPVVFRLRGMKESGRGGSVPYSSDFEADPRFRVVYPLAQTAALSHAAIDAPGCQEALAKVLPVDDWIRAELAAKDEDPSHRYDVAVRGPSAPADGQPRNVYDQGFVGFVVAAQEGRELEGALDWALGSPEPFDDGRAAGELGVLRAALAKGASGRPDLEAHLMARLQPDPFPGPDRALRLWSPALDFLGRCPTAERKRELAQAIASRCVRADTIPHCTATRTRAAATVAAALEDPALCDRLVDAELAMLRWFSAQPAAASYEQRKEAGVRLEEAVRPLQQRLVGCASAPKLREAALLALATPLDFSHSTAGCQMKEGDEDLTGCRSIALYAAQVLTRPCDAASTVRASELLGKVRGSPRANAILCIVRRCAGQQAYDQAVRALGKAPDDLDVDLFACGIERPSIATP
ncbi:MAG: hypothetical protein QM765_26980 [Myxococcales bacterium]